MVLKYFFAQFQNQNNATWQLNEAHNYFHEQRKAKFYRFMPKTTEKNSIERFFCEHNSLSRHRITVNNAALCGMENDVLAQRSFDDGPYAAVVGPASRYRWDTSKSGCREAFSLRIIFTRETVEGATVAPVPRRVSTSRFFRSCTRKIPTPSPRLHTEFADLWPSAAIFSVTNTRDQWRWTTVLSRLWRPPRQHVEPRWHEAGKYK